MILLWTPLLPEGKGQTNDADASEKFVCPILYNISRIFVILLHFFNDVNVKTLSCYIFSFIKNPPSNPQGPLKESWSNSQNSRFFFLALPCPPSCGGMGQVAAKQSQQQHTKIQSSSNRLPWTFCCRWSRCTHTQSSFFVEKAWKLKAQYSQQSTI